MATSHTCAICGKTMDPRDRQNYHIKSKVSKVSKHAHAECVTRDPSRAKAEGFLHEER
jgi:hypothetical protein